MTPFTDLVKNKETVLYPITDHASDITAVMNPAMQSFLSFKSDASAFTDANTQVAEVMGSGPFRYVAAERVAGSRVVFEKNSAYVPRADGTPSFTAGPKAVYIDRTVWTCVPDPPTSPAARPNGDCSPYS